MAVTLVVCHIFTAEEAFGYFVIAIPVSYCLFLAYQSILSLIEYFLKKKRINKSKEKYPGDFNFYPLDSIDGKKINNLKEKYPDGIDFFGEFFDVGG